MRPREVEHLARPAHAPQGCCVTRFRNGSLAVTNYLEHEQRRVKGLSQCRWPVLNAVTSYGISQVS